MGSKNAPTHSPGVAGAARRDGKALNTGDLVRCGWHPQPQAQGREPMLTRLCRRGDPPRESAPESTTTTTTTTTT
ncbi:MAG: hypothetical protein EXR72_01890 [Myxococcales bacterium]|nr:hypothetical protein [Myxococcales bacterium]